MTMGERIKAMRIKYGYTQEELGEMLGLKKAAINKYESGEVENIKRSIIKRMAEIFHVSPSWLLFGDEFDEETPAHASRAQERENYVDLLLQLNEKNQERLLDYAKYLLSSQQDDLDSRG